MTRNQIAYQVHLEDVRHNQVMERHSAMSIAETIRANREREAQGWATIQETERHNRAGELYNLAYLSEVTRHNKANESISWANLSELTRHNKAGEALAWANYELGSQQLAETVRSNKARESYNSNYLAEIFRSNRANEILKYQQYSESQRHNLIAEQQNQQALDWKETVERVRTLFDIEKFKIGVEQWKSEYWQDAGSMGLNFASSLFGNTGKNLPNLTSAWFSFGKPF